MSTTPPNTPPENGPDVPADAQPTAAYPAGYGQPGQYAPAPAGPDTRSKRIAWIALGLAIAGTVGALVGFLPILWVGFVVVLLAGLLLLAAFVFSLIGLIGKKNGGKGISVTALVLSIVGGIIGSFALVFSLVLIGLAASGSSGVSSSPTPEVSAVPTAEPTDDGAIVQPSDAATPAAPDAAAEAAFLADVRPKVNDIMASVDPSITPEIVQSVFPDDQLVLMGQTLLVAGDSGIDTIVDATIAQSGDVVPADTLRQLYQSVLDSAKTYLQ